jgi:cysteine-rich repeat protein
MRVGSEDCDDGNGISGDGCSAECTLELGWDCETVFTFRPDQCHTVCGDGINVIIPGEEVTFTTYDMVTESELSGVTYYIYSDYPTEFSGCMDTNRCGNLVASVTDCEVLVPADSYYLVVTMATGYYTSYFLIYVEYNTWYSWELGVVAKMVTNQDRVVSRWGHTKDLDLWVYDNGDSNNKVGWSVDDKSASFAGGTITLDVDITNGPGVETTQFRNVDSGTLEVWVNRYDGIFTLQEVSSYPATVDVYCYQCLDDNNQQKTGYVRSVTQNAADIPTSGSAWWKVGEFTYPAGWVRAKWTTCENNCYWVGPPGIFTFLAKNMVSGAAISGVTYEIYSGYPDAFAGCKQTSSCGSLVVSTSDAEAIVSAGKHYLIVASVAGYYTGYFTVYLGADGESLELGLVARMLADQDRVVLSWGHTQDLDLWVYDKSDMTKSVGWDTNGEPPSASFAGGTITLDVDVQEGPGVETTQFRSVKSGTIEVWVNHYTAAFTSTQLLDYPATVDVYCHQCLDDSNQQKTGYVKSVTQNAAGVPGGGRNWWKVGEFTWPSGPARAKWTTCVTDCYRNAEAADLTSTRALWSSAPKLGKEHASAALLRHMRRQPSSSAQFARHENFRVDCWGFVALAEPLSFQFGYTSDSGSFFFVPGVLAVKNLYLPSGNVQPVVKIQVGVFCFALVPR